MKSCWSDSGTCIRPWEEFCPFHYLWAWFLYISPLSFPQLPTDTHFLGLPDGALGSQRIWQQRLRIFSETPSKSSFDQKYQKPLNVFTLWWRTVTATFVLFKCQRCERQYEVVANIICLLITKMWLAVHLHAVAFMHWQIFYDSL